MRRAASEFRRKSILQKNDMFFYAKALRFVFLDFVENDKNDIFKNVENKA